MECPKCGKQMTQFPLYSNIDGAKPFEYFWLCEDCYVISI